jgi:hypothetical protein
MAWVPVDTLLSEFLGANGGTSASRNTVGANLIAVYVPHYNGVTGFAFSDSKGNTYTLADVQDGAVNGVALAGYYCLNPATDAAHTWSVAGTNAFAGVQVYAYSGAHATASFDQKNKDGGGGAGTSRQAGAIVPSADGALIIAGLAFEAGVDETNVAIDSGFSTVLAMSPAGGEGGASATKVQTTAASINPTWSWVESANNAAMIMSFLPAAGGGSNTAVLRRRRMQRSRK